MESSRLGLVLLLTQVSIYSLWNVVSEWSTGGIALPAVLLMCGVRALIASALMFACYVLRTRTCVAANSRGAKPRSLCPQRAHLKRIVRAGVVRALSSGFFSVGLSMAGAVNASVLHSTIPGITAFVAIATGIEALNWRRLIGIVTGMVGALVVICAEEITAWHNGGVAGRHIGVGTTDDAMSYQNKDDGTKVKRIRPQDHMITVSGLSTHDLHFSRAHVGLILLGGYCASYTGYFILMHALTRLKSGGGGDGDEEEEGAPLYEEASEGGSAPAVPGDVGEAAAAAAASALEDAEPEPPSDAVSVEEHYAPVSAVALAFTSSIFFFSSSSSSSFIS